MNMPRLTEPEIHAFGIDLILPYLQSNEGVRLISVHHHLGINPQIYCWRHDRPAVIFVRTAVYPAKGQLSPEENDQLVKFAHSLGTEPYLASVGIALRKYPDLASVQSEDEMRQPLRHGGYNVAYEGLQPMQRLLRECAIPELRRGSERPAGGESLSEWEAAMVYARMLNTLDCNEYVGLLADDAKYESYMVMQPLVGKTAVGEYLYPKMEALRGGDQVYAEMGVIRVPETDRPCVLVYQGEPDVVISVVLFTVRNGKISSTDLCMPQLFEVTHSGDFPA